MPVRLHEVEHVGDEQAAAVGVRRCLHLLGVGAREGDGLLHEDVLAGVQRAYGGDAVLGGG